MQRLQLNPDEKLTRKEYLKRKKKQANFARKRSKITYIVIAALVLLSIYVFTQFYVYSKTNNFKYVADDDVNKQKVYNVYYVTEGYTYDPVYSLNSIHSDGFNDKSVYSNSGLTDIQIDKDYIYGIKENGLYRINKQTMNMEALVEKDVLKYTLTSDRIYYITTTNNKLFYYNLQSNETKDLQIENISEIVVDSNNIFVVQDEKTKKVLLKYDKEGQNKQALVEDENVSYVILDENSIYFVNKNDANKIYKVNKDGSNKQKIDDISTVYDKGEIKEIDGKKYMFINSGFLYYINTDDGNTLWRINLNTKEKEKVISMRVEILQNVDNTIFYKVKNEMGVYLYNYDTKFMAQVTKRKLKEFVVDNYEEVTSTKKDTKGLSKN